MSIIDSIRRRARQPQGYSEILRVGLPLVAGMASSTVMQFTDRLFLSRYSVDSIAAAMPASVASMTISMTLMGVCGYTSVLIAQYVGSAAPGRVGSALWQGIWSALFGTLVLACMWWIAEPLFAYANHGAHIEELEVIYFRTLTTGAGFMLLGATLAGFYSGQGITRPVMFANIFAALLNIPLDYILIFGGFGIPSLGILGAGLATVIGWVAVVIILATCIFTRRNDREFCVITGFCFEWPMFRRLLRYGLPSGINFFMEMIAVAWFSFKVGEFGTDALAASNIAFSMNFLVFLPMIGLNIATSSLVGQAMGRGKPAEAERVTINTLHLALLYMLPLAVFIAVAAGPLMDIFAPGDLTTEAFAPVRQLGTTLLYFIAIYSLIDACNIVYFGALKGAGDTLGIMYIMLGGLAFIMVVPIIMLTYLGLATVITYWIVFTVYVFALAFAALFRFYRRGWHTIRVVETAPRPEEM